MTAFDGPREMTDDEIHSAFARMVAKQDYWRGYFGDDISDAEVIDWLDRAAIALEGASLSA